MGKFLDKLLGRNAFDFEGNAEKLLRNDSLRFSFPVDLANPLMDYMLERSYLEDVSKITEFKDYHFNNRLTSINWIRIDRLPVSPLRIESYDLLSRWQGALSSLHAWNQKIIFILRRFQGSTGLYIGILDETSSNANECKVALETSMPGIGVTMLNSDNNFDEIISIHQQIQGASCGGAVTGLPSFRKDTQFGMLQTLDKLAIGFKDSCEDDSDFIFMAIAEPIADADIAEIISRYMQIGSEIHTEVSARVTDSHTFTHSEGRNSTKRIGTSFGLGQGRLNVVNRLLKGAVSAATPVGALMSGGDMLKGALDALGMGVSMDYSITNSTNDSVSLGESVAKEYLNKFAQYTEKVTDMHAERLRTGRNLGFWNVGAYVLADSTQSVNLITGILRSVYSGDNTHIEPIRTHSFISHQPLNWIKNFQLVPMVNPHLSDSEEWHILGKNYQYISTPLNTEELSIVTSLPRYDVPGLRFVKSAVKFANNPGSNIKPEDRINLGNIVNMGMKQENDYIVDVNALVRHSLVVGSTGCGKTTTCKRILNSVLDRNIPILIIEPAKDEWVQWAIEQNKNLPDDRKITIFEPGISMFEGTRLGNLMLNPFQPAAVENAPIDMQSRCENVTALINSSLPTGDVLPIILDEAIYSYLKKNIEDFEEDDMEQLKTYPKLEGVVDEAKKVLERRGYDPRVKDGLVAALETRFNYLIRGKRGKILNNLTSTPYSKLFNTTCVINLSKIANAKDKALIMSIILLSLQEYRKSQYDYDKEYRRHAMHNELMHLTVIEEAHNVLSKPPMAMEGSGNPQQVVADLFTILLSEIRSCGEGLMIIDQVPTRLIPDAVKNTNYKICHRLVSVDDCSVMAEALSLRDDQKGIIPTLEPGNAIIYGDKDDAASWVNIKR